MKMKCGKHVALGIHDCNPISYSSSILCLSESYCTAVCSLC